MDSMTQFVKNDIILKMLGQLNHKEREVDRIARRTTSPAGTRRLDFHSLIVEAMQMCQFCYTTRELLLCYISHLGNIIVSMMRLLLRNLLLLLQWFTKLIDSFFYVRKRSIARGSNAETANLGSHYYSAGSWIDGHRYSSEVRI